MRTIATIWITAAMVGMAAPASAQLLGGRGGGILNGGQLGSVAGDLLGQSTGAQGNVLGAVAEPLMTVGDTLSATTPSDLLSLRRQRITTLVRDNRDVLDVDERGNAIRRDEIIGIALTKEQIAQAVAAGFTVRGQESVEGLALDVTTFAPPKGKTARKAIAALHALAPEAQFTLDPIYEPARAPLAPTGGSIAGDDASSRGARIGLIDGGVGTHPAFAGARIEQRGFAGPPKPTGHGTAVASLIVGSAGIFRGAAPGATLLVADVYGGSAANGSAVAIVRAMGWLAASGARVINISLVGSPNPLLEAATKELISRGILVVAAVGNDGPAAPPQYPASYPGVIAVTGVDAKGRALIEAGRALHLDFAAPGVDMVGAVPGGGWEALRGTSFAAPLVAARLARVGGVQALAAEARPGSGRVGRGIVCGVCATTPKSVGLK